VRPRTSREPPAPERLCAGGWAGDYRRAITLAQRSLEVNPKDALTWIQLAYYSARVGDNDRAERYASRALALGYPTQLVRAAPDFVSLHSDARFRQLLAQADKAPAG
jgi:tetratricopeptide (TPR) repeat protein